MAWPGLALMKRTRTGYAPPKPAMLTPHNGTDPLALTNDPGCLIRESRAFVLIRRLERFVTCVCSTNSPRECLLAPL